MKVLDYIKRYDNIDLFIVLLKELGYVDRVIMQELEVSKQSIYNAKNRWNWLENIDEKPTNVSA